MRIRWNVYKYMIGNFIKKWKLHNVGGMWCELTETFMLLIMKYVCDANPRENVN